MAISVSAAGNGLTAFSIHSANSDDAGSMGAFEAEVAAADLAAAGDAGEGIDRTQVDPAKVAREYLDNALGSVAVPAFEMPAVEGLAADFKLLGTDVLALTGTKSVKFRQIFNKIPVYGSLVTVELDENNRLLGINSALGAPEKVDPVAEVSPANALRAVRDSGGSPDENAVGRLVFHFDDRAAPPRWRLCYLFEDVPLSRESASDDDHVLPIYNYLIDAHEGAVVLRIPRVAGASRITADDELGARRDIGVDFGPAPPTQVLRDTTLNVHTYDHNFQDWQLQQGALTSNYCQNPPTPSPSAVSAHANATDVVRFMRDVLKRRNVDDKGGALISSVNCIYWRQPGAAGPKEWRNAAWIGSQMVYGQRYADATRLVSTAADLDVVAHEIMHGLTQSTANLEYLSETGALNESYSDIFGVIVANYGKPSRAAWDFRIGLSFRGNGQPLRDISNPAARGFPAHMDDYVVKPDSDDSGGVHTNSSIHNKAAHGIMVATDPVGAPLFTAEELAGLFYLALTQHLSRRSRFGDSRRALEAAALTLFRLLPQPQIQAKLGAIRAAFDAVGIV
jgi:Zn-dependent metalloprotease